MATYTDVRLSRVAEAAARKSTDPTRRKCFISYHAADADEVEKFLERFGHVFIARVIGVTDEDDFIDSANNDYVFGRIRDKYLADSTVTVVLVGKCTGRGVTLTGRSTLRFVRTRIIDEMDSSRSH